MKSRTKALIAAITLCIMLPFAVLPSSAMAPLKSKEKYGDTSKGIVNITSDSPVIMESQTVTFNLVDYPKYEYENPEEFKEYKSTVTTEYHLLNPTENQETLKLALPMTLSPDYGECNTELFAFTVNGLDAGGEVKEKADWDNNPNLPYEFVLDGPWYVYEITLAPGEGATTAVTSPIYPNVDQSYEPEIFFYNYIYAPYDQWAKYGPVDVKINTEYYIVKDYAYYDFVKADGGYSLHIDDLHTVFDEYTSSTETSVFFYLSTGEEPEFVDQDYTGAIIFSILLLIVIPIVLIVELVRTVINLIVKGVKLIFK